MIFRDSRLQWRRSLNVVRISTDPELKVLPEDVIKLLQSFDEILVDKKLLPMNKQCSENDFLTYKLFP